MNLFTKFNLFILALLTACSTTPKVAEETYVAHSPSRTLASVDAKIDKYHFETIEKLTSGIFHSYLHGQVLLRRFDKLLDENPTKAMNSDEYHELLSIRTLVDAFEDDINEAYLHLVTVTALPKYSDEQKKNAQASLALLGKFFNGVLHNGKELPENLKHLVLSNLREKQTYLFNSLKTMKDDSSITQNMPEVRDVFHRNMVLLRATRMDYYKKLKNFSVDEKQVDLNVQELSKEKSFISFKEELKKISKQLKKFIAETRSGRSTSSDLIFPSSGSAGNITGRSYPANTWSLTYDDGPGAKTSPTVLQNLKDRNMKATFFMLAKQVEGLPTTAKSIADANMDIASHSYDHAQLTKVGPKALEMQIGGSQKIIETKLGKEVKLFRLPYGAGVSVASVREKITEHKMIHIFWNVDTLDWQDKNPTSIFNRAKKQMAASPKNNGIVLFHDIHPQSVIASTMLMDYFKEQKLTVCTVQAVIDQLNNNLSSCEQ